MSFLSLIMKNPFRNKSRAFLAIIGIGIGIATIVALGGITEGLIASAEDTLHAGGTDITIVGSESSSAQTSSFGTTSIKESLIDNISSQKGVKQAVGVYSSMTSGELLNGNTSKDKMPMMSIVGIDSKNVKFADLNIIDGKLFTDSNGTHEVIVGKSTVDQSNTTVGDTLRMGGTDYKVVGIFESGNANQDRSIFMSLDEAQTLMDDKDNITSVFVKVDDGADVDNVSSDIEDNFKNENISVVTSLSDISMASEMIDMLNGASWGISLLAIVIGGIGIINTMLMSVFERTREIGVLKAVGWSDKRILLMIVGESIIITLAAGIVGSIFGVIGVELLNQVNFLGGLAPVFTIQTFVEAFAIAIIVGIIGGIYPAIKAIKLPPTEALRYE